MPERFRFKVLHPDPSQILRPYAFEQKELARIGAELVIDEFPTEEAVLEAAQDADVLLVTSMRVTERMIASMPNCKLIARYGIGVDRVDIAAATKHGIVVANTPTYCIDEVSTHAAALLLACARKLPFLDRAIREHWSSSKILDSVQPMHRLRGRTLGLIGFGNIGRAFASKMVAFGLNVIVYDPYVPPEEARAHEAKLVSLQGLLRQSDFVSIHAPLTDETQSMLGQEHFKLMKPSAFLINTARGAIVNERALYQALTQGWISGAGLDVLEIEPPEENNPLVQLENVIFGHHYGSYSEESIDDARREVCEAIIHMLAGKWPPSTINRGVSPRMALIE